MQEQPMRTPCSSSSSETSTENVFWISPDTFTKKFAWPSPASTSSWAGFEHMERIAVPNTLNSSSFGVVPF